MFGNIFKYSLCLVVTLIITGGVIVLPYAYYSANDKRVENDCKIEELKINTNQNNITPKEAVGILHSENSMMIQTSLASQGIDKNTDKEILLHKIDSAIASLKTYLISSDLAQSYIKSYEGSQEKNFFSCRNYIVSGTSNDVPVSVSVIVAEFEIDDMAVSITLDSETNTIYQLNMSHFYDVESEITDEIDDPDKIKSIYSHEYDEVYKGILNYWNETDVKVSIEIDDTMFVLY